MIQKTDEKARVLFFDIESAGLDADFSQMLCCGFKWMGEKEPFVITYLDYGDDIGDARLTKEVVQIINSADVIVSYFGKRFDVPFINARVLRTAGSGKREFIGIPKAAHIDLWETVKRELKLSSNRLIRVIEYLELDNEKTPVKGPQWMDARKCPRCAHKKVASAMSYIVDHCKRDVLALEEAYDDLRPLIERHPRILEKPRGKDICSVCSSEHLWKRGYSTTASALRKPRLQCKDCGHWQFGGIYKKEA